MTAEFNIKIKEVYILTKHCSLTHLSYQTYPCVVIEDYIYSDTETGNPLVAGFQDDLDPEDTLPNATTHFVDGEHDVDIVKKRESVFGLENEVISEKTKTVESEELHLNGEVAEITADALDTWLSTDSKWRQSPDGGEDSNHSSSVVRKAEEEEEEEDNSVSLASSSVHLELLEPKQLQQSSGSSSPVVPREKKNRHKKKVYFILCSWSEAGALIAWMLRLWVRIPHKAWMFAFIYLFIIIIHLSHSH